MDRDKQKIIEKRLKELSEKKNLETPSVKRDNGKPFPLSFSQQHLWIVDQVNPGNPAYNVPIALKLKGKLNFDLLEKAINKIIQRHEILRTSFGTVENQPVQFIHSELQVKINKIDLQPLSSDEQVKETRLQLSSKVKESFDLSKLPLIKIFLLQLDEETNILFLNIHHIVADGLSIAIILKELEAIYNNEEDLLPELKLQYADYSLSNTENYEIKKYENELIYWKNIFNDELPLLDLPLDKQRPVVQTFSGKNVFFSIDKATTDKLKTIAQENGSTIFMILLAAYYMLLQRYSSQEDIIIGVPVSTRTKNEYSKMVGYFLNMTALRINIQNNPTFIELLQKVTQITIDGFTNQNLPFEKVVENINFKRDLSRNPIFQTTIEVSPGSSFSLNGLEVEKIQLDTEFSQVDIALHLSENETGFSGRFEYNTDLFNESTIERLTDHFRNLINSISQNLNHNISKIQILSLEEKKKLEKKGASKINYKQEKVIHQLFEEAVERWPDSPAISYESEVLSYSELNKRSNQLAHYLISVGIKENDLIGIYVERSIDMIVGILAILKTGAGYLPIDLSYPHERTNFMLQDAGVKFLLTQNKLSEMLDFKDVSIILIDNNYYEKFTTSNPNIHINPDSLAYVIYTSGSTGKPKGVMVTHYNVMRLFQATDQWFNFNETDVWTLFHSYAFDFSVWEIYGALTYGGKLVIVPQLISRDPDAFHNLIYKEKVTVLNQTPSAFRQLIQVAKNKIQSEELSLRYIIFGGEALDLKSLIPWFELYSDEHPQLINMYGITETTVHVTYRPLKMEDTDSGSVIGIPISDLNFYILDKYQNLVPQGICGEIYVGGAGVAKGYLNRPELNKERFIENFFTELDGDRLYKTGDLAKHLDGDDIEYLGRIDHQVKIRGFRIELGEIEAVMKNYRYVKEVVVLIREDISEGKSIVAYLMTKQNKNIDVNSLRNYLHEQLPEYMVPSHYVFMENFPLTPNGKLDKSKLPVPEGKRLSDKEFIPPYNYLEKIIADVWQKNLKVNNIGIDDNFFDLGGHSLMMVKVNNELKPKLEKEISIVDMYRFPTIRLLAEYVNETNTGVISVDKINQRIQKQKGNAGKPDRIKFR